MRNSSIYPIDSVLYILVDSESATSQAGHDALVNSSISTFFNPDMCRAFQVSVLQETAVRLQRELRAADGEQPPAVNQL